MKFISKIRGFLIAGLMYSTMFSTMNCNAFTVEKTWQEAYLEVIESRSEREGTSTESSYLLYNIDDDEIPELFMWDSSQSLYALYTSYDGEAILCDEFSYRSTQLFYPDENGYFWSSVTDDAKWHYDNFYKLENGSCTILYSFCHDLSDETNGKHTINSEEVSKEEYDSKMAELEAEYPISWEDFMINGKLEYTYDQIRQYLLNSMEEQPATDATEEPTTEPEETKETQAGSTTTTVSTTSSNSTAVSTSPKTGERSVFALSMAGVAALLGSLLCRRKK